MRVIDTHVHVFETLKGFNGKGELTSVGQGKARWATGEVVNMIPEELGDTAFTADACYEFLKEKNVEKAVLLQGSFYGFQNEYVAKTVEKYPEMFIGAGTFDPMGAYANQIYHRLTDELKMKVMKFETSTGCGLMSYHSKFDLAEILSPIGKVCKKNGQTLVLDIGSPGMNSFQPEAVVRIANENPELKLVICHLLAPTLKDEEALKQALEILAGKNVYFDLAAVPFNVNPEKYPYPTGVKYIKMARDIVGYDKLMWGTDIPSVLCYDSYENLLNYLIDSGEFSEKEMDAILYSNALRVYPFE